MQQFAVSPKTAYVRFRYWRIDGERGVNGQHASVWLTEEYLTVQIAAEPPAHYRVAYQRGHQRRRDLSDSRMFEMRYRSPQLPLLELRTEDRRLMFQLPAAAPRRGWHPGALVQLPLLIGDTAAVSHQQGSNVEGII